MSVTVYTLPSCVQCDSTKKFMSKNDIEFVEVDLTQDMEAYKLVKSLGYAAAPVVVAGEDHWSGFRPDKIQSIVA